MIDIISGVRGENKLDYNSWLSRHGWKNVQSGCKESLSCLIISSL